MQSLDALIRDASALASGAPRDPTARSANDDEAEVDRILQICNACRYCEGFCAVFPAMTRRIDFPRADIHYLANLCHNCGACLHACQYAAPHEFAVNVPKAMARVRRRTYVEFAWPAPLGRLYERNGLTLAVALATASSLFLALASQSSHGLPGLRASDAAPASFYAVFPHGLMAWMFGPVFAFALLALGIGGIRFWRAVGADAPTAAATADASLNVLTLKYLDGGHGEGCNERDDAYTLARRRFHHLTFYGFILCVASTSVATLYHYALDRPAPYGWTTLPKLLGGAGGVSLLVGCIGLWWLNRHRHAEHGDAAQQPMDLGFIALLVLTSASGLTLSVVHASSVMPWLLCLHLGAVMALFATLPYGKFAHGVYRTVALLKWAVERRQPNRLSLGGD